jgi:hypothetical protein
MTLTPARANVVRRTLWWAGTIWSAIAIILMLVECALVWWVVSFEAFVYTISPLNFRNWIFAVLVLLPGGLLIKLGLNGAK